MLIILPILAFSVLFLDLVGLQQIGKISRIGWRAAFLQATLLAGVFIALQSELLGLFKALTQPWVALFWLLALSAALWIGLRKGILVGGWRSFAKSIRSLSWLEIAFCASLGVILGLLFLVAYLAVPNNTDSLLYHMARVVHWAQDRSLAHYPVAFQPQLLNPIGAEVAILNFRLLWGNDQLANLVQWFSMVACLIGVSALAAMLGAGRKGQMAAVGFAVSLPMGILQATSTQNDYVTALWLISLALFVGLAIMREAGPLEVACIGMALGLGLLTKGTYYPYAVPLGVWLIIHWLRQRDLRQFLWRGVLIVAIVGVLNLGYWTRNTITYGGPLGSGSWISNMTSGGKGPASFAAHLVENTALNFAPPDEATTDWMLSIIRGTFKASVPEVKNFQLVWAWNHEDLAGNPLHMFLIPVTIIGLLVLAGFGRVRNLNLLWYSLVVIGSFLVLTLVIHFDQYGVRYQVPFFISWAPVFGVFISKLEERHLAPLAAFLFLLIALPWVFFNTTRPLIAIKKSPEKYAIHPLPFIGSTMTSSILEAGPETILFANWAYLRKPYIALAQAVVKSGCKDVGLRIDSHDIEYEFWWLLGAPQDGTRIESVYYSSDLARYADPAFKPCAIICTICSDRTRLNGLNLTSTFGETKLFTGDTYNPDENK